MSVPFLDVGAGYRELRGALDAACLRVMGSGRYVGGAEVEAFEREFAAACGVGHAVGVGNGLDALTIALRARDIGPGDEVIVPAHTFIATWLAVTRAGATIVPVDVDPMSLLIQPSALLAAITSRTAAVVPVHLYGLPVDLEAMGEVTRGHGLLLLADAAQAHGAQMRKRGMDMAADVSAYSFYPAKNLGAFGDAGALTTDDGALAQRARRLRSYGASERYRFAEPGVNSRLDPLQAALLRVKLEALDRWNRRRAEIARRYLNELPGVPELTLPFVPAGADPAWHLFCIRHPRRDALAEYLGRRGIQTQIHYPEPPHLSSAYAELGYPTGSFPVTEHAADTLLSLPIGPHLSEHDVDTVIGEVRAFSG